FGWAPQSEAGTLLGLQRLQRNTDIGSVIQRGETKTIAAQVMEHHTKGNIAGTEILVVLGKISSRFVEFVVCQQRSYAARAAMISLDQQQPVNMILLFLWQMAKACQKYRL